MTAAWPDTLPAPLLSGYGFQPVDAVARTNMDNGFQRHRRRFTTVPTVYTVSWVMTADQLGIFEGWFDSVALYGAEPFTISLRNGAGRGDVTARFVGAPKIAAHSKDIWKITGQLSVSDRPASVSLATETSDTLVTEAGDTIILE